MAEIIQSKRQNDKVLAEILMDYDEALRLKGHFKKIQLFSEKIVDKETHVSHRGRNSSTKYFLIPRELRKGFKLHEKVECQRIDTNESTFFVYKTEKFL